MGDYAIERGWASDIGWEMGAKYASMTTADLTNGRGANNYSGRSG